MGAEPKPAFPQSRESLESALRDLLNVFSRHLYLPDAGVVLVTLGTVAANLLEGDPVWTLLVGPPGSGKTEVLNALIGLDHVHLVGALTEPALLSGTPKKEVATTARGGLLRQIGRFGILVPKDFTSVLSMHRDSRAQLLAALREIYDGAWVRMVGTDGGRTLAWEGKIGMIGGVTPVIDNHHAVMAAMGERFLLYRLPAANPRTMARRALSRQGRDAAMRAELSAAVKVLFSRFRAIPLILDDDSQNRIIALSTLVARARSAVERDGYTREVELVPGAEMPARLALALARLDRGMAAIGVPDGERWRLVCKTATDCIPALRWRALNYLWTLSGQAGTTSKVAEVLGYPTTTIRRALEDLAAYGLIWRLSSDSRGKADTWKIHQDTVELLEEAGVSIPLMSVPEMSEGE